MTLKSSWIIFILWTIINKLLIEYYYYGQLKLQAELSNCLKFDAVLLNINKNELDKIAKNFK